MCLWGTLYRNQKYVPNKKNGGIVPPVNDIRVLAVPIGCGKCIECRKQESRKWQTRLQEDIRTERNGKYITLTFSNQSIKEMVRKLRTKQSKIVIAERKVQLRNGKERIYKTYKKVKEEIIVKKGYETDNDIATIAMRLFNERWRKKYGKAIRHWMVTELGHEGTENIHMHGILWTNEGIEVIRKIWKYGYVYAGKWVADDTINYCVKYIHKMDADHKEYKPKVLCSDGIGGKYIDRLDAKLNKYKEGGKTNDTYKSKSGHKQSLNTYWRNKIYTDEEREKLWLEKLDTNIRWVRGEKIDISNGEEEYYKTLEWHRRINAQLGYGDNTQDWNRKKEEQKRREYNLQKRLGVEANANDGLSASPDETYSGGMEWGGQGYYTE